MHIPIVHYAYLSAICCTAAYSAVSGCQDSTMLFSPDAFAQEMVVSQEQRKRKDNTRFEEMHLLTDVGRYDILELFSGSTPYLAFSANSRLPLQCFRT